MDFEGAVLSALVALSLATCPGTVLGQAAEIREAQWKAAQDGLHRRDIHNISVEHTALMVPIKLSVLDAVENSVACVLLRRRSDLDNCQAKRVYGRLEVELTDSLRGRQGRNVTLRGSHMEACGPVLEQEQHAYLCFQYEKKKAWAGSAMDFRRLRIRPIVVKCQRNFLKFASGWYDLENVSVETKVLRKARVSLCPGIPCQQWLERESACPVRVVGMPGLPRYPMRGVQTFLIAALAVGCGVLTFAFVQTTRCVRPRIYFVGNPSSRTVPAEKHLHLSAKECSSDANSPVALAWIGAEAHRESLAM